MLPQSGAMISGGEDSPAEPGESTTTSSSPGPHAAITNASGETLYLHSLKERLMAGDDPWAKLIRAIENDEFLLRLREEEDNLLPPGGFIPVAEHYGLTEDIDRWVVRTLLNWSVTQRKAHPE